MEFISKYISIWFQNTYLERHTMFIFFRNFVIHKIDSWCFIKVWPWESNIMVKEVKSQGHAVRIILSINTLSFQVNWNIMSWNTPILKFDIENSESRWGQMSHSESHNDTHSDIFRSMLITHPITVTERFKNLSLNIQGQGLGHAHTDTDKDTHRQSHTHRIHVKLKNVSIKAAVTDTVARAVELGPKQ